MARAEQLAEEQAKEQLEQAKEQAKELAGVAQSAEHLHGKEGVRGSSPLSGSNRRATAGRNRRSGLAGAAAAGRMLITGAG